MNETVLAAEDIGFQMMRKMPRFIYRFFSQLLRITRAPISSHNLLSHEEMVMELMGKTISGVVAVPGDKPGEHNRIWLLQFTDGTHVEFVSPNARRRLSRLAGAANPRARTRETSPQLSLEVA